MSLDAILGRRPDESLEDAANRVVDELLAARARNDTMRAVMLGSERKADAIAAECNAAQVAMAADCQAALDGAAAVVAGLTTPTRGDLINARARAGAARVEAEDAVLRTKAGSPERAHAAERFAATLAAEDRARAAERS